MVSCHAIQVGSGKPVLRETGLPVNVSINGLAEMAMGVPGKKLSIRHVEGPQGVRGRHSDNDVIREKLGWGPPQPLREGIEKTYAWIAEQVRAANAAE